MEPFEAIEAWLPWIERKAAYFERRWGGDVGDYVGRAIELVLDHWATISAAESPKAYAQRLLDYRLKDEIPSDQQPVDLTVYDVRALVSLWSQREARLVKATDRYLPYVPRWLRRAIRSMKRVDREVLLAFLRGEQVDQVRKHRALQRLKRKVAPPVVPAALERTCKRGHVIPHTDKRCRECRKLHNAAHYQKKQGRKSSRIEEIRPQIRTNAAQMQT